MRCALYLRCSTDEQTVEHQRLDLERWAAYRGHTVVATYSDEAISGGKGRNARPGLDAALRGAVQRKYDVLAAWDITRLGRSTLDLHKTLEELRSVGCDLYLHEMAIDTSTPAGEMFFTVSAAFATFERKMVQQRVKAALRLLRDQGKVLGRPVLSSEIRAKARTALLAGCSVRQAAEAAGCSRGTVGELRRQLVEAGELRPNPQCVPVVLVAAEALSAGSRRS
jgi:DNA invertase Pin-like site-specific DNA recombinase